jgi:branched-chain amino acid transport system permease protein
VSDLIKYVILGIPYGCVFALVATGLVLTYKTSGVFNLAFGAQAFLSAAVYFVVRVRHGWPMVPAFVLAVLVVAPLVGLIFDRFLFRHLRSAPEAARLVTSLGLLVAVPQLVLIWLGGADTVGVVGIWSDDNALYHFGQYTIDGRQAAILLSTAVVVVALIAMFRWSPIGLQMRAVVESPRMTQLAGINADRVSAVSWMISSVFAGLAGVLLAPLLGGRLDPNRFTFLLVAAIAAAVFGRLSSIPLTVLGGILLGVVQGLLAGYLPPASLLAQNLRPALPFLVLFLLLIFLPGLRRGRALADPLAGVDPPPPSLAASERSALLTNLTRVLGVIVVLAVLVLALTQFDEYWLGLFTRGLIYSTIFLSITVFTGMAGQISLCQAAFAGVGGFGTAQLVSAYNLPVLTAVVIGALLAAVVGALLAIPVLRLAGIYLSLATLAFGLMFEGVVIPLGWVSGGVRLPDVPRPQIGPINFANDRAYLVLCLVVLAIVGGLVILVRRGTTGRYLDALRGSEVASESIGINPARAKIVALALSAGIAGLGGGLLASYSGQARPLDYSFFFSLFWIAIVVSLGARTVEGAINAGMALVLFPEVLKFFGFSPTWQFVFFGLGAITYARHPEGILESQKRRSLEFVQRLIDRRGAKGSGPADGKGATAGAEAAPEPAGAKP